MTSYFSSIQTYARQTLSLTPPLFHPLQLLHQSPLLRVASLGIIRVLVLVIPLLVATLQITCAGFSSPPSILCCTARSLARNQRCSFPAYNNWTRKVLVYRSALIWNGPGHRHEITTKCVVRTWIFFVQFIACGNCAYSYLEISETERFRSQCYLSFKAQSAGLETLFGLLLWPVSLKVCFKQWDILSPFSFVITLKVALRWRGLRL